MRLLQENSTRARPKVEKKGSLCYLSRLSFSPFAILNLFDDDLLPKLTVTASRIAFGYGGASATIKSFGAPKGGSNNQQGSASNGM